jgi:hypothetical protein
VPRTARTFVNTARKNPSASLISISRLFFVQSLPESLGRSPRVLHEVGRVGGHEGGLLPGHEALDVGKVRAVAAEKVVVAEHPEVAQARDRALRRLVRTFVLDLRALAQFSEEFSDLVITEPDALHGAGIPKLGEEFPERGLVPRGQLPGAVQAMPNAVAVRSSASISTMSYAVQPSFRIATRRPLPAMTRPVPLWTTRGSAWPNRWRLAMMASRFSSGWRRALAGSRTRDAVVTRRTCSVGTDMGTHLQIGAVPGDSEVCAARLRTVRDRHQ